MIRTIRFGWAAAIVATLIAADAPAQEGRPEGGVDFEAVINAARAGGPNRARPSHFRDFNEVTRGAEKVEGLFTLHKINDHLYAEIRPDQFNQTLLVPITIARGLASAGVPVGDDETVLDLPPRGRPRAARPAQYPLQGTRRHAAGQGGQAELHRLDPDGPADRRAQPDRGARPADRLRRHLHDRLRPARLGLLDRNRSSWFKVKGFHEQHGARGRGDVQRRRPAVHGRHADGRRRPSRASPW